MKTKNILFIISLMLIITISSVLAEDSPIGYEFLDDGSVVHIWNNASISNYYFDKDSGIQLTNHYEDYWTKNIFCIGYYNNDVWNKIACADELSNFQKSIDTDNENYVTAILWKDIEYGNYDLRFGVQYHLGLNDENLSITIYGKNIGIDIPFDLGFAWKITDWNIPLNESDDYMVINNTGYPIKGTYDLTFKDLNETSFKGRDSTYAFGGEFLRVNWNENLNYAVKMYGNGVQEDFYIALLINAGHFDANQEKSTTFQWIDALVLGTDCGFVTSAPIADPNGDAAYPVATRSTAMFVTSPSTAVKVTEIGWWAEDDNAEGNFEVGIYTDDGNDEPELSVFIDDTNTKTTGTGWKTVTTDWDIDSSTNYWLAVQCDVLDQDGIGQYSSASKTVNILNDDELPSDWGTSSTKSASRFFAIYAVWETDTTSPIFTYIPENSTLEYLVDNLNIDFNATDSGSISWYINDTDFNILSNGTLTNSTGLDLGTYYILVNASDGINEDNTTTFKFNVTDTVAPYWTTIPANQSIYTNDSISVTFIASGGIDDYFIDTQAYFTIDSTTGTLTNTVTLTVTTL